MDWTGGATLKTRNDDYTIGTGRSNRAFVEMLKSHGKMHDPETDTALDCGITYNLDKYATTVTDLLSDFDYRVTNSDTTTDSILTEVTKQLSEPRFNQAYHMSLFFAFNDLLIASTYAVDCARPDGAANSNDIPLVVCRRVMPNYGEAHIDS